MSIFSRATSWIVTRPLISLTLLVVISTFALIGYYDPELITKPIRGTFDKQVVENGRETAGAEPVDIEGNQEFRNVSALNFRGDAVVVVECESIFTPDGAAAIRHVVDELRKLDFVKRVFWMDEVPPMNAFGLPEPLLPRHGASQNRFDISRQQALRHPFIVGTLMSRDGNTILLLVNFEFLRLKSDEDCISGLRQVAERAAADFPTVPMKFSITGSVPIEITAVRSHELNQFQYQIIAYVMIAVMSIVLFRGVVAVIVVALAPAMGIFWTLGLIQFFGYANNPFIDVVLPILVSLVGFTDGVHLMVQIRRFRVAGHSPRNAAIEGIRQVGLACFLTSLTTAIGFGSLWMAHQKLIQEFGTSCVVGVGCSFVAVVTTIPLVCATRLGNWIHVGHDKSLIDKNLNKIGGVIDFVLQRKKTTAVIGILVTGLLFLISLTLRPDQRNFSALPIGSEPAAALAKVDKALGGLETGVVEVSWTPQIEPDAPEVFAVIAEMDKVLEAEPLIGFPVSIRKIIDSLPGEGDAADRFSMVDLLPASVKRTFYSPEERTARISFRVQDLGIAKYGPVFERILAAADEVMQEHSQFKIQLLGDAVWRWEGLYQIVVDLLASLGTASVIIFSVLAIVYRSVKIGLISIIPNIFPLAVAGTYLALTGQALEVVTVCAFTVCLGIAVDDTIHFLTRYFEERNQESSNEEAIRRAFIGVGTALIITTIVLVSGFMSVVFSDSRDHHIFASMGAITISAALFGDMVFLPAMLACFGGRTPRPISPPD
jgi:predicted RND superfamily exporter protein